MLASSHKVRVKAYQLPDDEKKTFTLNMKSERRILEVYFNGSAYMLLVEEPVDASTEDFEFTALGEDEIFDKANDESEVFDKPNDVSYLGVYTVLTNRDEDRPTSAVRYLYGQRKGQSMGGAQ